MVLDCFDHHAMLIGWRRHLHAPGASNRRVRNIAVTGDLIGCIDDHHSLVQFVGKNASGFPQKRRLSDTWATEEQHALAGLDEVAHDGNCSEDSATNSAGKPDNFAGAIADSGDAMKRSFYTGSIVPAKRSNAFGNKCEILAIYFTIRQRHFPALEPRFGCSPQVHDDLDEIIVTLETPSLSDGLRNARRKYSKENV
jgi:hypothetical protein